MNQNSTKLKSMCACVRVVCVCLTTYKLFTDATHTGDNIVLISISFSLHVFYVVCNLYIMLHVIYIFIHFYKICNNYGYLVIDAT